MKYQTPKEVAEYMVGLLPEHVITVLEPTKGEGTLVTVLSSYEVTAPGDYFFLDTVRKFDAVVMNPPFSSKSLDLENMPEWMNHYVDSGMAAGYYMLFECMDKADIVIALMPWYTISDSDVRMRAIMKFGLKSITVLPRKTFNYARIQTCVLELVKGWEEPTEFKVYELWKQKKK